MTTAYRPFGHTMHYDTALDAANTLMSNLRYGSRAYQAAGDARDHVRNYGFTGSTKDLIDARVALIEVVATVTRSDHAELTVIAVERLAVLNDWHNNHRPTAEVTA